MCLMSKKNVYFLISGPIFNISRNFMVLKCVETTGAQSYQHACKENNQTYMQARADNGKRG